ncbi:MAG: deoxyribose-phosphate aldolase [Acidobacteriaceae bacterium]|nr:deoxyribose-phosphate aldolase [Acidobacteriaceae bacterium]MBV9766696.1 deoxyribose-phosphate aldolase [Acidobacteriaceae bacterium]
MTALELAQTIDHTLLKPEATEKDILKLCQEAAAHRFFSVCVNPYWVSTAKSALSGTNVAVCAVAGFPLGANKSAIKAAEAEQIVHDGGLEVDMVLNVGRLKEQNFHAVEEDIATVRTAIGPAITLKVIIESALLTDDLKREAAKLVLTTGANFVKTSTGFSAAGGATVADIELLHSVVRGNAKVKASGGIRNLTTTLAMLKAGADRIGASAGVAIIEELTKGESGRGESVASGY